MVMDHKKQGDPSEESWRGTEEDLRNWNGAKEEEELRRWTAKRKEK